MTKMNVAWYKFDLGAAMAFYSFLPAVGCLPRRHGR